MHGVVFFMRHPSTETGPWLINMCQCPPKFITLTQTTSNMTPIASPNTIPLHASHNWEVPGSIPWWSRNGLAISSNLCPLSTQQWWVVFCLPGVWAWHSNYPKIRYLSSELIQGGYWLGITSQACHQTMVNHTLYAHTHTHKHAHTHTHTNSNV